MMYKPDTEEHFREWNEAMIRKYGTALEHRSTNIMIRLVEQARVRAILRMLDVQEKDQVLDVGCGAGNILARIKRGQLFGLDLSDTLLALARRRLSGRAKLTQGDAEDMTKLYFGQTFTKIYTSELLEHVLHPERVVKQMHRLIDPNGILVVSIPHERLIKTIKKVLLATGLFRLFFPGRGREVAYDWHLHDFDLPMLHNLVRGKFLVQKVRRIPFWFLPLRYVAQLKPVAHF